ncbi:iron-containing alcohol dehydrogenase [Glaciecola petra]|uniref:Iron-containing alcohol dehydrogenase n=1 Tax=Glaciecola petra TaxID=3075602 RepID=A0ABU2ZXC5_9ALTE|nr:iron-containing alcohol dehydrogenase [Aestuariibacter sp. P117]MDT0596224.1 iron-containing alcohol dehydrogenase [Aestuariibacter sp. P117]
MQTFSFITTKKIISKIGGTSNCAHYCNDLGIKHPLIVSDPSIVNLGLIDELTTSLKRNNIAYEIFDKIMPDPSDDIILEGTQFARDNTVDGVIGFGGGSSLDAAKAISVLLSGQQNLSSMYGIDQIKVERSPLILIPTTAGTGSEVTPISILTTGETTKSALVSEKLLPDIALLDAQLTLNLPPAVTASCGIDAMVHAIEAFTSKEKKNDYSDMLAHQALKLLSRNIETATHQGKCLTARQNMLLGACLAGQAFANAPVGAVHALAYPLGGHFKIPHGQSNAIVLPHVLRFNASHANDLYAELCPSILPESSANRLANNCDATENLSYYFQQLMNGLGLSSRLRSYSITENHLSMLAEDAMQQTRLLGNNPKPVTFEDALQIYQQAY